MRLRSPLRGACVPPPPSRSSSSNSVAEAEALVAKLLGKSDAGSALVRSAGTLDAARVRALLVD